MHRQLGPGPGYELTCGHLLSERAPIGRESLRRCRAFGPGALPGQAGLAAAAGQQTAAHGAHGAVAVGLIGGGCRVLLHGRRLCVVGHVPADVLVKAELQSRKILTVLSWKESIVEWGHEWQSKKYGGIHAEL